MQIAPGEPVPPGFENEVKAVAELQTAIDNCKDMSLIGLEYVLELTPNRTADEPSYLCVLCETRDDLESILLHVSSFNHRSKYLVSWWMIFFAPQSFHQTNTIDWTVARDKGKTLSNIFTRVRRMAK